MRPTAISKGGEGGNARLIASARPDLHPLGVAVPGGLPRHGLLGSRRRRDERAKAICQDCPVLDECRDHALSTREPYGVWGGMSEEERRAYYERQARRFADEPA